MEVIAGIFFLTIAFFAGIGTGAAMKSDINKDKYEYCVAAGATKENCALQIVAPDKDE